MHKTNHSGLAGAPPATDMLRADVDSPQKKLLNARAQKVTNFKLGLSEPPVVTSVKHSQYGGFSPSIYTSFNPVPPSLPSNTKDSHFGLGNPIFKQFQAQTSHKANFVNPPEQFQKVTIDPQVKDRLSQAHWEIGTPSTGPILNTITKLSYQQRHNSYQGQNRLESIKNIQMMRGHHYTMGDNRLNYETTANRKEHDLRNTHEGSISPEKTTTDAKLELAKHHFDFGHEDAQKLTTHQRIFTHKMLENSNQKHSRTQLNKINLGEGVSPPMHTTTQAEFKTGQFSRDQNEESILYSKLRRVNIKYGEHIPVYETANRKYGSQRNTAKQSGLTSPSILHQSHNNIRLDKDIEARLKQSYVALGDDALANAYFNSTQQTFYKEKGPGERDPIVQTKEKTLAHNFSIGGSNNLFMTQTSMKDQFQTSPTNKSSQPNTDFVKHLKANHFQIAHDHGVKAAESPSDHFKTLHQNYFRSPSNSTNHEIRNIAAERKQELTKNHFDFGSPTLIKENPPLQSTTKAFYNPPSVSPAPRHPNLYNNAGALKHKSVNVMDGGPNGKPGAGFFASNTASSFKWVQPQFV